ncbi:unnamed protein product [Vicia faba]|uniref:Uncharacterized protein n=1 Tax=Vicia faba TaxID=3906 RepID=A0AAV1AWU2_VICFA|nr:unnamed protein product [Vicia faba]
MKRNPLILIYNEKKLFFLQVWIHQLITSSMARPLETVKDINESKDSWKIATTKVKDTGSAVKNVLSVIESLKKQVAMKHIVSLKNLNNRQKLGCEKGTGIDRARMNMTKNSGIS